MLFARWERDNTPIAAFPGKYEWAGDRTKGDCSLRILNANFDYDNGGWVCQVRKKLLTHFHKLRIVTLWKNPSSVEKFNCSHISTN